MTANPTAQAGLGKSAQPLSSELEAKRPLKHLWRKGCPILAIASLEFYVAVIMAE